MGLEKQNQSNPFKQRNTKGEMQINLLVGEKGQKCLKTPIFDPRKYSATKQDLNNYRQLQCQAIEGES